MKKKIDKTVLVEFVLFFFRSYLFGFKIVWNPFEDVNKWSHFVVCILYYDGISDEYNQ